MKLVDIFGLNITSPYKEAVLPFLDCLDTSAKQCGAVNTILRKKNRFVGINTDGAGFLSSLQHQARIDPKNKTASIIGAGGAARSIAAALANAGAKTIFLLNRHPLRAEKAAQFLKRPFRQTKWKGYSLSSKNLRRCFLASDILIQTTPALLSLPLKFLPGRAIVCDILYQPLKTPLLLQAKKHQLKTLDGLWMLLHQARLNLKLWTGRSADIGWMRKTAIRGRVNFNPLR